jgi:hypothetical protein
MTIKRYEPKFPYAMEEVENGAWVKYSELSETEDGISMANYLLYKEALAACGYSVVETKYFNELESTMRELKAMLSELERTNFYLKKE